MKKVFGPATVVAKKLSIYAHENFFYFYLCIYPPDSQESDGGANT